MLRWLLANFEEQSILVSSKEPSTTWSSAWQTDIGMYINSTNANGVVHDSPSRICFYNCRLSSRWGEDELYRTKQVCTCSSVGIAGLHAQNNGVPSIFAKCETVSILAGVHFCYIATRVTPSLIKYAPPQYCFSPGVQIKNKPSIIIRCIMTPHTWSSIILPSRFPIETLKHYISHQRTSTTQLGRTDRWPLCSPL